MKNKLLKIWKDYRRISLLLITLIGLAFYLGMVNTVLPVTLVIPLFAVVLAHIVRKTIHGYIDTEALLKKVVEEDSIASAMVIVGVLLFTIILTVAFTMLLV